MQPIEMYLKMYFKMYKVQLKWLGTSHRYAATGALPKPPWQRPRRGSGPVPQWPEAMASTMENPVRRSKISKWTSTHQKNNEKYRNIMKHHLKYSKIEVVKIAGYSESYSIYFMMGIVRTGLYSIRIYHVVSQEPTRCGETRRPYLLLHRSLNNLLHIPLPGWSLE